MPLPSTASQIKGKIILINLGIIGTGWISDSFVDACIRTGSYRVYAICSRNVKQAEAFGVKYGAEFFYDDIRELAGCDGVDAVYIATPNALHYEQCLAALRAGKHAIVEKPAFSNVAQAQTAFATARKNGVLLLEAIRSIHEANHRIVKEAIARIGPICGVNLVFMKRSPRYDMVLAGDEPGIFSLRLSGGALMDLGVYLIYDAVDWFGTPESAVYYCQKAHTGADTGGVAVLRYPGFDAELSFSKICNSRMVNEIRSRDYAILVDPAQNIRSVRWTDNDKNETELAQPPKEHWMEDEAQCFARLIAGECVQTPYESLCKLSLDVHALMTEIRLGAGIVFPADAHIS